jgi:hypothetical protein
MFLYSGSKMADTKVKRREKFEHFSLINFPFYIDKKACTMYILFALSYKNALRITFDLFVVGMNTEKSPFCSVQSQIYIQSRIYTCNFLSAMKILNILRNHQRYTLEYKMHKLWKDFSAVKKKKAVVTRTVFYALVRAAKNIPPQNTHVCIYSFFTRK